MKQIIYFLFVLMGAGGIAVLPSCKKTSSPAPIMFSTPLQALINSDTSLSVFYAAVKKAGDDSLYGGTAAVTVLIPTNAAFASQGITAATIQAMPANAVDSLLRYHFITDTVNLTAGIYNAYNSKLGPVLYGYGNPDSTGNYFNGSLASSQKLPGSNATVYLLSAPLRVPASSIALLIASDTSLSYFAEAVKHTGLDLIPGNGWNTILAPVNAAFIAAGYPTLESIDNGDVSALTNILQYHVLPGQYFTNSFTRLPEVTSLQGGNIAISFSAGIPQFTGTGDTAAAAITTANRIATPNIVLQNMNGVLMP